MQYLNTEKLRDILIIGSSCSGKTSLYHSLGRVLKKGDGGYTYDHFGFAQRYITRPRRLNDDNSENVHVTRESFDRQIEMGEMPIWWEREIEVGRTERYGFNKYYTDKIRGAGKAVIFSANNAFVRADTNLTRPIIESALVVVTVAPRNVREERLSRRSPDLSYEETALRLADGALDIVESGRYNIMDTCDKSPEECAYEVLKLL
jgi:ribose 1,5-bisphosphokinase PhnN